MTLYLSLADTGFFSDMCKVSSHKCSSLELQGLTILCKNRYNRVAETGIYIASARWQQSFFLGRLWEALLGALSKGHEVTSQANLHFEVNLSLCHELGRVFYASFSIGIENSSWRNVKAIGPNPFLLLLFLFSLELLQGWIQHMMNNLFSKAGT